MQVTFCPFLFFVSHLCHGGRGTCALLTDPRVQSLGDIPVHTHSLESALGAFIGDGRRSRSNDVGAKGISSHGPWELRGRHARHVAIGGARDTGCDSALLDSGQVGQARWGWLTETCLRLSPKLTNCHLMSANEGTGRDGQLSYSFSRHLP